MKPLLFVGEARGAEEDRLKPSFVGPSGVELLRMLNEASVIQFTADDRDYIYKYWDTRNPQWIEAVWAMHPELARTNVFNLHPKANNLKSLCGEKREAIAGFPKLAPAGWIRSEFQPELDRLGDEVLTLDPNLIICLGNSALWALAGRTGVTKLRGTTLLSTHTVSGYKLLPTFHPAAVLRQWEVRPTTIADLMKASREQQHPDIRRPRREIWIEPSLQDIERFFHEQVWNQPPRSVLLSTDIETSGTRITCIGFSPRPEIAIVIPFDDDRSPDGVYWQTQSDELQCWEIIRRVLEDRSVRKLFQNGAYDIAFLLRAYGIRTLGAEEDTMLLQHALQPESLKGLGYLGSIYTDEGAWKHMRKKHETIKRDE